MRLGTACVSLSLLLVGCGIQSPASIEYVSISPETPRLGDVATVTFKAVDDRGEPLAGQEVNFKLSTDTPGVSLSPTKASTIKGSGLVSTQVVVSTRVSSVVVVATAGDKSASSPALTFAGGGPNGRQFTFQCGELAGDSSGGRHAISAYDESRNMIAGVKINCIAHVGDRNGDGIAGALVSFLTEAGTIGPTEASQSDVIGNAKVLYKSSLPLPKDVAPATFTWTPSRDDPNNTGEYLAPLWMQPFLWHASPIRDYQSPPTLQEPRRADPIRPNIVMNPRDNLVSMIAVTAGEEGFDDRNNNGKWDDGETFDDLTEPFVDSNDNGTWDPDERWVDVNGDGVWNGKNGVYDANTLIWVQERIIWTGIPNALDTTGPDPVLRVIAPVNPPAIEHYGFANVTFLLADPWLNTMAQNGDGDGCHTATADDKPLVTMIPSTAAGGVRFTYPSTQLITFTIKDAHDLNGDPPPPAYPAPVGFSAPIVCTTTGSPIGGQVITLDINTIVGTVL